jgi:cell division protein FtsZ
MGVGEDDSLGDSIAVTIIATGFNVEQQNEIVNTEPKKIIHSLDGEQKLVHDLSDNKSIPAFEFSINNNEETNTEEKIIFELLEEETVESNIIAAPTFELDLIPTSELIKNLEVIFEIVSPEIQQEYFFSTPEVKEIKIEQPVINIVEEEQITFTFDMPIQEPAARNEDQVIFELTSETKEIEVKEPVQFVSMTEVSKDGIIKYSLEEYMEIENELSNSKPATTVIETPIAEELNITVKQVDLSSNNHSNYQDISPMDMSIEETLKFRADERRRKLKEFNYKFHNNPSRVDEYEKEPAYKRTGVELSNPQTNNSNSRMSLGTDSNDDTQLRSNNSFLHDNVD